MSKGKLLAVCIIWLMMFGILVVSWRWMVVPSRKARDQAQQEREHAERMQGTSSDSHYQHRVTLALDSFSGYAILRSPEFHDYLSQKRIKLDLKDDNANYRQRIQALRSGEVDMATFTVDALIKNSVELDELPATIVAIIDETRGADAMIADKSTIPNVDALNRVDMRFVLVPDSPSETLTRVVMADFQLDNLPQNPFVAANDAEDVFSRYRTSKRESAQAYVVWQPYVSRILDNSNMHVVVDSSRFRGYIVDVIVARRDFLLKNRDVVRDVVGAYFRAAYQHREDMPQLVAADASRLGDSLSDAAVKSLVNGIWWKNTQENFAHMGLAGGQPLQHLEDVIDNITQVLLTTGAITRDPTEGLPNVLYFDGILRDLQASQFHPGLDEETVRDDTLVLPELSAGQWERLVEVGTLQVPRLVFARGSYRLTGPSERVLDDLGQKLKTWPQYYVLIRGNASTQGDNFDANKELAQNRAKAAERYLVEQGAIDANRVRAVAKPSGSTSVSFLLGQPPY